MKKIALLILFFGSVSCLLPFSWLLLSRAYSGAQPLSPSPSISKTTDDDQSVPQNKKDSTKPLFYESFDIYLQDKSKVVTVAVKDYIIGAVAAEMPLSYPPEALKSQAVAAYSYATARTQNKGGESVPLNADFEANPSMYQGFVTKDEMKKMWGDAFEKNYSYLTDIVNSVEGDIVMYGGKPALTCYFPLSNGLTNSSDNIFGLNISYLVSVQSEHDKDSPEYEQKITYTSQQIYDALTTGFAGIKIDGEPAQWFSDFKYDDYGYLKSVEIGGVRLKASELREKLGLRSTAMETEYKDEVFIFTTFGSGHCVGMSQYGAKSLAQKGHTYIEILQHYYPGTSVD